MEYINKKGIVKSIGQSRTEFPNGAKVMVKSFVNGKPADVPGVNIGVKFDFDADTWYSGNFTQADVDKYLQVGKAIDIKTWSKESNGKTYYNFAISYPKKADTSKLEEEINILKITVHRQGQQIMSMYAQLQKLTATEERKEVATMFDDDAKELFPEKYAEIYGESSEEPPLEAYDDPSSIPF